MKRSVLVMILVAALGSSLAPALAGVTVYEEGNKKVEIGARIQLQYARVDPDGGSATDELFFRRLRPYLAGTVSENWFGLIQIDFGDASGDDEVKIKDAYMVYSGLDRHQLFIGNTNSVFSREFLTSSKRQQLIERTFTGDHNYGSPDRQLGLRLDGHTGSKKVSYSATLGMEGHDPSASRMDFDSLVNGSSDWNEGALISARVDFHPLGFMKFDQADFHSDAWRVTVGISGFSWDNDDDNNTYTDAAGMGIDPARADLDSADGFELGFGVRGHGFSADVAAQRVAGETVDPSFTGGMYLNGETDLDVYSVEGGYLFPETRIELVAGYESLEADNYQETYSRKALGLNYYINEHKVKLQLTYTLNENFDGVDGVDRDELQVQAQYVW